MLCFVVRWARIYAALLLLAALPYDNDIAKHIEIRHMHMHFAHNKNISFELVLFWSFIIAK